MKHLAITFLFISCFLMSISARASDGVIVPVLTNSVGDGNEPDDSNDIPSLVWSQSPIEIDPNIMQEPVFCGWNESARSIERTGQMRQWRMDADDFQSLGLTPVTRVRWWGGYKASLIRPIFFAG